MAFRLYYSAWVELEGQGAPVQVFKDRKNPAAFNVGEYQYDVDGKPLKSMIDAPVIGVHGELVQKVPLRNLLKLLRKLVLAKSNVL